MTNADPELKAKIEAFKQERLGDKRKEFVETIAGTEEMDMSQG